MAGLPPREGLDGESLLPLATGQSGSAATRAYACYMGTTLNTSGYMLRQRPLEVRGLCRLSPQLFDLEADPGNSTT
jgi:hypothetical protein